MAENYSDLGNFRDHGLTRVSTPIISEGLIEGQKVGEHMYHEVTGYMGGDYRPNPVNRRKTATVPKISAAIESPRLDPSGFDYVDPEETAKRRRLLGHIIKTKAKEIWKDYAPQRERFEAAEKVLAQASKEQKANPTDELKNCMSIVEKGPPITKQKCVDMAKQQLRGQVVMSDEFKASLAKLNKKFDGS